MVVMMVPTPNCSSKFHSLLHRCVTDLGVTSTSFFFLRLLRQQVGEDHKHHQQVSSTTTQPPQTFCKLLTTEMTEIVYCSHLPSFTHLSTCTRRYETSPPPKAIIKPGAELQPHLHWHHQSPQIHHHHHPRHPYYHHHHYSHSPITPLPTAAWIATPVMMVSTSTHTQKASSRNCAFEWESIGTPKIHSVHSIEKELSIYGAHRCPNCSIRMWRKPTRWYPNPKISLSECEFPCSQRFPVSKHIIRWKSAHDFFPHRKLRSSADQITEAL